MRFTRPIKSIHNSAGKHLYMCVYEKDRKKAVISTEVSSMFSKVKV